MVNLVLYDMSIYQIDIDYEWLLKPTSKIDYILKIRQKHAQGGEGEWAPDAFHASWLSFCIRNPELLVRKENLSQKNSKWKRNLCILIDQRVGFYRLLDPAFSYI